MHSRFDASGAGMGGRNVLPPVQTPPRGGSPSHSEGMRGTPTPGIPERNTLSLRERVNYSGDRCQGRPEYEPEYSGGSIPAHSGGVL